MNIFEALNALQDGEKIRNVKMPLGVFMELKDGKIMTSLGHEVVSLSTSAKYEKYEEEEPEYINKILLLLDEIKPYLKEECTYNCEKCRLNKNDSCLREELSYLTNIDDGEALANSLVEAIIAGLSKSGLAR